MKRGWVPYSLKSYRIHDAFLSKPDAPVDLKKKIEISIQAMKSNISKYSSEVDQGIKAGKKTDEYYGYIYTLVQSARL